MSSDPERNIDATDRLMALVALSSQELPDRAERDQVDTSALAEGASEEDIAALHAHLDANPATFERFLQQHRAKPVRAVTAKPKAFWRDWLAPLRNPVPRYVLGFVLVLFAVLVALPLYEREPAHLADLDRSYGELQPHIGSRALESPAPAMAELGFSPRGQSTDAARNFAAGWNAGQERLRGSNAERASPSDLYFALGQWNALLSVASESHAALPQTFWRAQLPRERELARALRAQGNLDPAVARHLERVETLLSSLANGERPTRSAYELAEELRVFREGFGSQMPEGR